MEWPLVGRQSDLERAVGLVESGAGIALLGPAGVGKSRLLHELVGIAEQAGKAVVGAVASEAMHSIPFAPFVELLPEGPTQDRLAMLGAARGALVARAGSRGLLLAVDDAHHLDETSLAFLVSVVASNSATVVLTARTGAPMRRELVDLWTNGVISRVEITALDRIGTRLLVEAVLGVVSDDLADELWRLTEGNPLLLHELIEGAVGDTIEETGGVWRATGSLTESSRLFDLVTSRLNTMPEGLRPAMDVVAVASPLPLSLAEVILGEDLARLEDRGLAMTVSVDEGRAVVPAHPMYGEILKTHLGDFRARRAHRRLVRGAIASGGRVDPVRVAIWQQETGEAVAADVALSGAREALVRHDLGLAQRLVEPLDPGDDRVGVLLGRALSYQQQFAAAEEALAGRTPGDESLRGEIASIRAQNLGFGLGRVREARQILESTAAALGSADLRARLLNQGAMISAINGDFRDAISTSELVLSDSATSEVSKTAAYATLTVALAMIGDCARFDEIIDEAREMSERVVEALPLARDQIGVMEMSSLLNAGRIPEAVAIAEAAIGPDRARNAMTTAWMSATGLAHLISGDLRRGSEVVDRSIELFAQLDPFGLEAQARGLQSLIRGQMGDPDAGATIEGLHLAVPAPRLVVWVDRGRAWAKVVNGDVEGGAQIATEAGRKAVAGEHYAWGALAFHDAVRLGHPEMVIDGIRALIVSDEAHLITAIGAHAEALVAEDSQLLRLVGARMMAMGAPLFAAETFAQASSLSHRDGDEVMAARLAAMSIAAESRCFDVATPALRDRPGLLTQRQVEVAMDAARGSTSAEISVRRFISVRTVDNHLSTIYRKLGVSGREELPAVLAGL